MGATIGAVVGGGEVVPGDGTVGAGDESTACPVRTVDGADHFFLGKLYPLGEIIAGWAREIASV